ncbi:MAG: hypothetical protein PHH08_01825 [Candidatus ainarchaeum sp.]|nr:hypothetical protein [Candidatus ainarchaeum sp.]
MSFAGRIISNTWKILVFLLAFGIVVYVSLRLRFWSGDFTTYFLRTENWGMLVLITLIGYIVSTILTRLLVWQFHLETRPEERMRRRR